MKKLSAFILTMVMLLLVIAPVTNASALDIESIENSKSPLWQTESCVTEVDYDYESAEVFDLCYGFCFPLRCCRFWQPRLDFPNTALDCGIFVIYILIITSDFEEGKEFFFKNKQV